MHDGRHHNNISGLLFVHFYPFLAELLRCCGCNKVRNCYAKFCAVLNCCFDTKRTVYLRIMFLLHLVAMLCFTIPLGMAQSNADFNIKSQCSHKGNSTDYFDMTLLKRASQINESAIRIFVKCTTDTHNESSTTNINKLFLYPSTPLFASFFLLVLHVGCFGIRKITALREWGEVGAARNKCLLEELSRIMLGLCISLLPICVNIWFIFLSVSSCDDSPPCDDSLPHATAVVFVWGWMEVLHNLSFLEPIYRLNRCTDRNSGTPSTLLRSLLLFASWPSMCPNCARHQERNIST